MTKNVGIIDRRLRIALGVIVLLVGLFLGSWWGLVGLIPLGTGLVRWCPLYAPFNISTQKRTTAA